MNVYLQDSSDGIWRLPQGVAHRDDEYSEEGFSTLLAMQDRHFWYRGRHRFISYAVNRHVRGRKNLSAIDLGGGVGGWVRYCAKRHAVQLSRIALGDSSLLALAMAQDVIPADVERYQIDLMNLGWRAEWDMAFLLDVIEHLPDDAAALEQVALALRPKGLLFVTAPALECFWSYNDVVSSHLRRYSRHSLASRYASVGLKLLDVRYFMFALSPLYWLVRYRPGLKDRSVEEQRRCAERAHRVPSAPANALLSVVFCAETPLGHWFRFPWGTSILGVFEKQ